MGLVSVPRLFGALVGRASQGMETAPGFVFGDASYIREHIAALKGAGLSAGFPIVALYWGDSERVEVRPKAGILLRASIRFIIADSSTRDSNETRMESVYERRLHPILEGIVDAVERSGLFDFGYGGRAGYTYSEGYGAPFNGLVDGKGKDLAEMVDYVSVRGLTLPLVDNECLINAFMETNKQ